MLGEIIYFISFSNRGVLNSLPAGFPRNRWSVEPPPSLRAFLPRDGTTQTRPARQSELCRLSYAWLFLLPHKKIKDFLVGTPFTSPKMRDLRYIPIENLFLALT